MAEFVQFPLQDGTALLVVRDRESEGVGRASRAGDIVEAAASSFGGALSSVRKAALEAMQEFRRHADAPDEVELEFGVLLTAEAGAVIAKTGVEGHLKVTMTWKRDAQPGAA